jgi:hypothetical protein
VAIDAIEASKIEIGLADIVENFIRCEVVEAIEVIKAHAIPDSRFIIPNRSAGALS